MDTEDLTTIWNEPTEFKGIKLYPITMKDSIEFSKCAGILTQRKNQIPDARVIAMSYLDFLFACDNKDHEVRNALEKLLGLVLKNQIFEFIITELGHGIRVYPNQQIDSYYIDIDAYDFEDIRKIILNQNLIEYNDEMISKEFQKELDKARKFVDKHSKEQLAIKELIVAYHCASHDTYENIKNMNIQQFYMGLARFNKIKDCEMFGAAINTGMIQTQNDKTINWLDHINMGEADSDVLMKDETKQTIKNLESS